MNLTPVITLDLVRFALQLPDFDPLAAHLHLAPEPRGVGPRPTAPDPADATSPAPPREAGVLALLFDHPDPAEGLHVVLTRRTESLRGHSGQISFPGGRRDPEDASFTATALRETCEELGVCEPITILGELTQIYIPPSHYNVYPSVGYLPYLPRFTPNAVEVAEVFTVSLGTLLDPRNRLLETRVFNQVTVQVPYYLLCGHKVWGATGIMLSELEHRVRTALLLSA